MRRWSKILAAFDRVNKQGCSEAQHFLLHFMPAFCFPSFFNKSLTDNKHKGCFLQSAERRLFSVGSWRNSIWFWIICKGWGNQAKESLFNNGWFLWVLLPQSFEAEFKPCRFIRSMLKNKVKKQKQNTFDKIFRRWGQIQSIYISTFFIYIKSATWHISFIFHFMF